ncbi:septal ring lytic transglycosylase RlpA family protein [Tellurirhabdus rosea]|uniref:septal ring lytic transglycosylase RlpA family protein n=1 Tax=Tellurirhabdus rosea TaxID=2674997 RepID=UPI002254AFE7|nr:septal ring lytic transglycosylase RlpA family protein [Tellurirhabdus rosea]
MSIFVSLMLLLCSIQPNEAQKGLIQRGKASFYSKRFTGQRTAYGERVRVGEFTAAHRTLPHNTLVEVTNLSNNKSVVVRINDRGPYGKGRIIDLGFSAAKALGMLHQGIANVTLRVVGGDRLVGLEPKKEDPLSTATSQLLLPTSTEPVGNN